jgi:hypothetical protein
MAKMQTLTLTFALPTLLGKPGVVRTDWIAEGAQRAANDLSDQFHASVEGANECADMFIRHSEKLRREHIEEVARNEARDEHEKNVAQVKAFARQKKIAFAKAAVKLGFEGLLIAA